MPFLFSAPVAAASFATPTNVDESYIYVIKASHPQYTVIIMRFLLDEPADSNIHITKYICEDKGCMFKNIIWQKLLSTKKSREFAQEELRQSEIDKYRSDLFTCNNAEENCVKNFINRYCNNGASPENVIQDALANIRITYNTDSCCSIM